MQALCGLFKIGQEGHCATNTPTKHSVCYDMLSLYACICPSGIPAPWSEQGTTRRLPPCGTDSHMRHGPQKGQHFAVMLSATISMADSHPDAQDLLSGTEHELSAQAVLTFQGCEHRQGRAVSPSVNA